MIDASAPSEKAASRATPTISVILPVYNGAAYLERTLPALRASDLQDFELIVVNDGSTDSTAQILRRHRPDVLLENPTPRGPFAARNQAVERARGQILFFTDADVLLRPDTLSHVAHRLTRQESTAVIGLYSPPAIDLGLCTFYKTSWVRFSYLQAPSRVGWFFTAVGGLRKGDWDRCGAFQEHFSLTTGGGDIDYGRRLVASGVQIHLDKSLAVTHLKQFTLASLLRNDFNRALGYCRLALRQRREAAVPQTSSLPPRGIANVGSSFVAGVVTASLVAMVALLRLPSSLLTVAALVWLGVNRRFATYLWKHATISYFLASLGLLWIDQLVCAAGVGTALAEEIIRRVGREK